MDGDLANVVKYLSLGVYKTAFKSTMTTPVLSGVIRGLVVKELDEEMERLCKIEENSILRKTNPEDLISFEVQKLIAEIDQEAPFVSQMLKSLCTSKNKKRAERGGRKCHMPRNSNHAVVATIGAMILHARCPEMSALAYRIGLVLRYSGAGGIVCSNFLSLYLFV